MIFNCVEDINTWNDYIWDDSDELLEDFLLFVNINQFSLNEEWKGDPFKKGTIVMSGSKLNDKFKNTHRLYVIDNVTNSDGEIKYHCYLMSSRLDKANINNNKFPYNIYIKNYGSIIDQGAKPNKDAIIKLDQLYEFDNSDFDVGAIKGYASKRFQKFIDLEINKIRNKVNTSKDVWDIT